MTIAQAPPNAFVRALMAWNEVRSAKEHVALRSDLPRNSTATGGGCWSRTCEGVRQAESVVVIKGCFFPFQQVFPFSLDTIVSFSVWYQYWTQLCSRPQRGRTARSSGGGEMEHGNWLRAGPVCPAAERGEGGQEDGGVEGEDCEGCEVVKGVQIGNEWRRVRRCE